jgi:hypothetical protein
MGARAIAGITVLLAAAAGGYAWQQSSELAKTQGELAEVTRKLNKLETELAAANTELARLAASRALPKLAASDAVPLADLCAVPEAYAGKTLLIRSPIFDRVIFSEPATHLRLVEKSCLVHGVFTTRELGPEARRLLQSVGDKETLQFTGRLVLDKDSPYKGMRTHSGYQFIVSRAERLK